MTVEVIVPWGGGCAHRERALRWVRRRSKYPLTIGPGPTPWSKGAAVMPAVAASTADVIVIHDADVWCDGLDNAVQQVQAGAAWAVPHRDVFRLDEASTAKVLAGAAPDREQNLAQRPYAGMLGGGIVVATREVLLAVPIDPRFVGWGQEDESWGIALTTMLGPPWRGRAPLYHLWHPPQDRISRRRGNPAGWRLRQRFSAANGNQAAMRLLLAEGHHALSTAQPPRHDHPPVSVR